MNSISRVVMLGAGNVSFHLSKAFQAAGIEVLQVYSRSLSSAGSLAKALSCPYTDNMKDLDRGADLYVMAVADDAIAGLAARFPFHDKLLAHTAGSVPMDVLRRGTQRPAVLYPLQSLSREVDLRFDQVPLCLEVGREEDRTSLESLARKISNTLRWVDSHERRMLHVAAVFACNFVNHMYALSAELMEDKGLPFSLLHPLIQETARKASLGDPRFLQTGPARRNDMQVIEKHLDILLYKPGFQKMYTFISQNIRTMYE